MRIAIHTVDVPICGDIYSTCGSEARWALNWSSFLQQLGHEVTQVYEGFSSREVFDWYFQTTGHSSLSCGAGNVLFKNHIHLMFELIAANSFNSFDCYKSGLFAYPNWELMSLSNSSTQKHGHTVVFLPTPYLNNLIPFNLEPGFGRREITWMLKRVWTKRPLSGDYVWNLDSYADIAVWTLEAIRELSLKYDLTFNYVRENCYSWGREPTPPEAQRILDSVRGLNYVENLNFRGVLDYMSRSKLSISIGGLTGSALESVFCGCVPLAYDNPSITNETCITPTTLTHVASSRGLTLPRVDLVSKKDIYEKLEDLWTNASFYYHCQQAFQEAFEYHKEEYCLQKWKEFLSSYG